MGPDLSIIGGGLAGCEAAWQAAERGMRVMLYEMRPDKQTGAHKTGMLAELVCSNSLGSKLDDRAPGQLKWEAKRLGSLLLKCAQESEVDAGRALAVDRNMFSGLVTRAIEGHPNIKIVREEVIRIPEGPTIIAAGPLVSDKLASAIGSFTGEQNLYFYDAVAPIVTYESIDMTIAFWGSRYEQDNGAPGDYINCPFSKEQFDKFQKALTSAERAGLRDFEKKIDAGVRAGPNQFFEGCLPIEVLASRNPKALTFGPLRPVGLKNPNSTDRPYAVVQLRRDNLAGTLFNLVGFQTNLIYAEQRRVFRMIPGLENAEFCQYGRMHRNTFIHSPSQMCPTLQSCKRKDLFFAGQIIGIEGYVGSIATGALAGINAACFQNGEPMIELPPETMLGALCRYITQAEDRNFQPMKANFGILKALEGGYIKDARLRAKAYVERGRAAMEKILTDSKYCA